MTYLNHYRLVIKLPFVSTSRAIRNPLKTYRLLYVLSPWLTDFEPDRGNFKKGELEQILEEQRELEGDAKKTGGLEVYRLMHSKIYDDIKQLKNLGCVFTTPLSVDLTEVDNITLLYTE